MTNLLKDKTEELKNKISMKEQELMNWVENNSWREK